MSLTMPCALQGGSCRHTQSMWRNETVTAETPHMAMATTSGCQGQQVWPSPKVIAKLLCGQHPKKRLLFISLIFLRVRYQLCCQYSFIPGNGHYPVTFMSCTLLLLDYSSHLHILALFLPAQHRRTFPCDYRYSNTRSFPSMVTTQSTTGLVVKSNVAIVGPRVRFAGSADF
jgi:hypothetical protein